MQARFEVNACNRLISTLTPSVVIEVGRKVLSMKLLVQVTLVLVAAATLAAGLDYVEFTIVERIRFSVPSDWPVLANKSTPEKTIFAFQIPNSADVETSDSSNLSIRSSYIKDAHDRDAFAKSSPSTDPNAKERKFAEGWRCATFSSEQKSTSTQYVIWDCSRVVADCGVSVRIAWPHLPKNPPDYDKQMETVLNDFLTSVAPSKPLDSTTKGVLRRNEEPH